MIFGYSSRADGGLEQARAYAFADFEAPHTHVLSLLLQRTAGLPATGRALDLGCGPADITLRVARALPEWRVDGVDGSPAMLHFGVEATRRAGLEGRVRLVLGRLPDEVPPERAYDLVFSNSLLHHLPVAGLLWDAVRRHAKPGAPVFIMDLMRPESLEAAAALVEQYSGDEPEILKRDSTIRFVPAFPPGRRSKLASRGRGLKLRVEAVSDRAPDRLGHGVSVNPAKERKGNLTRKSEAATAAPMRPGGARPPQESSPKRWCLDIGLPAPGALADRKSALG